MSVIQIFIFQCVLTLCLWILSKIASFGTLKTIQSLGYLASLCLLLFFRNDIPFHYQWIKSGSMHFNVLMEYGSGLPLLIGLFAISIGCVYFAADYFNPSSDQKFWAKLSFFITGMCGLLITQNLLGMFFFWEWIGLASFILIGYDKKEASSGISATYVFLTNRIGDVFLLFGIILFLVLEPHNTELNTHFITSLCIVIGTLCKSAQMPFSLWLSKAMAGPTPVSALLHSATLVAAGAYFLLKVSQLLHPQILPILMIIGALTAVFGAYCAIIEKDIKQILAFSTLSQLGFIFVAIGSGNTQAAYLHLFVHAFYKSTLFIGFGLLVLNMKKAIHSQNLSISSQSIDKFFHLKKIPWFLKLALCISGLALMGVPFTSSFLTKESIYDHLLSTSTIYSRVSFGLLLIASIGTCFYTTKILIATVLSNQTSIKDNKGYLWIGLPACFYLFISSNIILESHWLLSLVSCTCIVTGIILGFTIKSKQLEWLPNVKKYYESFIHTITNQSKQFLLYLFIKIETLITYIENVLGLMLSLLKNIGNSIETKLFEGSIQFTSFALVEIGGIFRFLQNGYLISYILAALVILVGMIYFIM